jgi:hypothetical protein
MMLWDEFRERETHIRISGWICSNEYDGVDCRAQGLS